MTALLRLCKDYRIRCCLAAGGRQAVQTVRDPGIDGVIAVACEDELLAGIYKSLPKPVLALINLRPNGPCFNTKVEVKALTEILDQLMAVR